jgi:hypothetical protein
VDEVVAKGEVRQRNRGVEIEALYPKRTEMKE